jgi:hypothetical protein
MSGRPAVVEARVTARVPAHKPRTLTPQEWTFVEEFCAHDGGITLKEAAIRAGYGPTWAKAKASELTDPEKNPHVVAAIQERRRELGEKYGTTYERHMRDLQLIRDEALKAGAYGAAVQAEYRRGQALGTIYIDRKEIRHGTIDSMSKDEVLKKLQEIKRLYGGGPVQDVTPREVLADPELVEVAPGALEVAPGALEVAGIEACNETHEETEDADQAGDETIQPGAGQPNKLPYFPD